MHGIDVKLKNKHIKELFQVSFRQIIEKRDIERWMYTKKSFAI